MTSYIFSQLIDFTRTTSGTFVGSNGLIQTTPASVNLLTYTQEFDNAAWTKSSATAYPFDPATASVGSNAVVNGDFASATGWTVNAGWVIGSGVATATATSGSLYGGFTSVSGQWYKVTFDCTVTSGTLSVAIGLGASASFTTGGTKTVFLQSGASTSRGIEFYGGAVTGTVDNVVAQPVTINNVVAPDGTSTADTLAETAATLGHVVSGGVTVTTSAYVFSVYLKKGSGSTAPNWLQLYTGGVSAQYANFNLGTGAVGSVAAGSTATITSVGNGWYRCTLTFTPSSGGGASVAIAFTNNIDTTTRGPSYAGATTSDVFAWGAQLELGSTATAYTRNYGGLYPPRFDYDPVTLAPRGLLVEEQRTNLLLRSEEFDDASWTKASGGTGSAPTVTANAAVAPDGTTTADQVVFNLNGGTTSSDWSWLVQAYTATAGVTYSFTVWVRTVSGTAKIMFDSASSDANLVDVTTTWTRVSGIRLDSVGGSRQVRIGLRGNNVASGQSGSATILIWGAQLEAGAFATSYIPTVASQVTRTADVATIQAPMFAPWYNATEGTFVAAFDTNTPTSSVPVQNVVSANDNSGSTINNLNRIVTYSGTIIGSTSIAGVTQADINGGSYTTGAVTKAAYGYIANNFAISVNGAAAVADTSGSIPSSQTALQVGSYAGANNINGHIRSIRYYPTRLTNAQLQALTA